MGLLLMANELLFAKVTASASSCFCNLRKEKHRQAAVDCRLALRSTCQALPGVPLCPTGSLGKKRSREVSRVATCFKNYVGKSVRALDEIVSRFEAWNRSIY